jgi:hypothetical protein
MRLRRQSGFSTFVVALASGVLASSLLTAGAWGRGASSRGSEPRAGFGGRYAVTFRITNAKGISPTRWVFAPSSPCPDPCRSFAFRVRLRTESTWRRTRLQFVWSGRAYVMKRHVLRGYADCRGSDGRTVRKGFDVGSTETLRVTRIVNSLVTVFNGTGRDSYVPNDAGRKAGCAPGSYTFAIDGTRN